MFGLHYRRRLVIISTLASGEAERVDIGDDSQYVNIVTSGVFLPGTAAAHCLTDSQRHQRPADKEPVWSVTTAVFAHVDRS